MPPGMDGDTPAAMPLFRHGPRMRIIHDFMARAATLSSVNADHPRLSSRYQLATLVTISTRSWMAGPCNRACPPVQKMAALCGAAKFREETSKKANSAVTNRIAATHNLGARSLACKRIFATQHCSCAMARLQAYSRGTGRSFSSQPARICSSLGATLAPCAASRSSRCS
jgi:hypothetical protein